MIPIIRTWSSRTYNVLVNPNNPLVRSHRRLRSGVSAARAGISAHVQGGVAVEEVVGHEAEAGSGHERFPLHPEILEVAQGSFRTRKPPRIRGSGYVVRSLEAALWAFHDAVDFRQAVLRAVNLGDDADTTGAVCGQLAGAWFGESGIPAEWRNDLAGKDQIDPILQRLIQ